jgi:hypothetical protein
MMTAMLNRQPMAFSGIRTRTNKINKMMKTIIFFFTMLISVSVFAQATVTPVSVDYASKKVTFKVAWTTAANDRVWVWVDLCPVVGTSPSTFAKAEISAATGSGVVAGTLNERGFYVNVNGATVTATLSNATGKFNWCAYGSHYPPNAIETAGTYTLKGSQPFIITTAAGTAAVSAKTYTGSAITALTDATGCPGVLCGQNGEPSGLLNCCVTGTTNCSGACTTTGTYTTNDGPCTGACKTAYKQIRDQCSNILGNATETYTSDTCGPCVPVENPNCTNYVTSFDSSYSKSSCKDKCKQYAALLNYNNYGISHNGVTSCRCYACY